MSSNRNKQSISFHTSFGSLIIKNGIEDQKGGFYYKSEPPRWEKTIEYPDLTMERLEEICREIFGTPKKAVQRKKRRKK